MEKIRVLNLSVKNLFNLEFDQDFTSNLVAIFGYNRTGKTNLIKALKHAFFGFRDEDTYNKKNYSDVLAGYDSGNLEITFYINNSIIKIHRQIYRGREGCEIFKLDNMSWKEYNNLEDLEREAEWAAAKKSPLFSENYEIVKSKFLELKEILISNGIYPNVFGRLIATENNAEFKRAVNDIGGSDGDSGYEAIKNILHEELTEKDNNLKHIQKSLNKNLERLNIHKNTLSKEFRKRINNQVKEIQELTIEVKTKENIVKKIDELSINGEITQQIKQKISYIEKLSKKVKNKIVSLQKNKDGLEGLIPEIEKLSNFLEKIEFRKIYAAYFEAQNYFKRVQVIQNNINAFQKDSFEQIPELSEDLPSVDQLLSNGLNKLLNGFSLPEFRRLNVFKKIITTINNALSEIKEYYNKENLLRLLLQQYNVSRENIWTKRSSYEKLLRFLEGPDMENFDDIDLIPLKGQIIKDDHIGSIIQVFIDGEDLKKYIIEQNQTLKLAEQIIPIGYKDDEMISKTERILDDLIKAEELNNILNSDEIRERYESNVKIFQDLLKIFEENESTLQTWYDEISKFLVRVKDFIQKYDDSLADPDFEQILKVLHSINTKFTTQIVKSEKENRLTPKTENLEERIDELLEFFQELIDIYELSEENITKVQNKIGGLSKELERIQSNYYTTSIMIEDFIPALTYINEFILNSYDIEEIPGKIMESILNYAADYYHQITGEDYLYFERYNEWYIKSYIIKPDGTKFPIIEPSGSEQSAISLGIMTAVAEQFDGFIVIDESTDRLDGPSRKNFSSVIKDVSENYFTIIVLKVNSPDECTEQEFDMIQEFYEGAQLLTLRKDPTSLRMTCAKPNSHKDIRKYD